jgi:hypothetical protein
MMARSELDNGEYFMRRHLTPRAWSDATQQMRNEYLSGLYGEALRRAQQTGERAAEDVTGLRMLEEFLAKRKGERDGDERK